MIDLGDPNDVSQYIIAIIIISAAIWISPFRPEQTVWQIALFIVVVIIVAHQGLDWGKP